MSKTTTVVNLFGGPGAGKTTCAWEIAAELKKKGFVTEYVSEYAKELVWNGEYEKLNGTLENQKALYEEQKHRVERLIGKVDFVVTDSPTLLSLTYLKEPNPAFEATISEEFKANNNFCMIVQRGDVFEAEGRIHTLEQSKQIDAEIQQLLVDQNIPFGVYQHHLIDKAIGNIVRVHWGHSREAKTEKESHPTDCRWFALNYDKCISVWYSPDKYDGDQLQMKLEERAEDGSMGPHCEVIIDESYATADLSYKAIFETLTEIYSDAEEGPVPGKVIEALTDEVMSVFNLKKPSLATQLNSAAARVSAPDISTNAKSTDLDFQH